MKRILRRITDEPALAVALVLAVANIGWDLSGDQVASITTWVESIVAVLGGFIVRQQVTPVAKLKRQGMHP